MIGRPKKPGIKVGYRISNETAIRIGVLSIKLNKTKSAIVDEAIELLAKKQINRITI